MAKVEQDPAWRFEGEFRRSQCFSLGARTIDLRRRKVVSTNGDEQSLTHTEVKLLAYLYGHPNREVPRQELYREVWGYSRQSRTRAAANLISRLRKKIEDDPSSPEYLQTVFGVGFMLSVAPQPKTLSVIAPRSVLPQPRDRFVGRQRELGRLRERLAQRRLVTILGPGGVGKSRLAVALGRSFLEEEAERWPGGVWFVPLSEVGTTHEIVRTLARTLAVSAPQVDANRLGDVLKSLGRALIILDNAEHIVEPLGALVGQWLSTCPDVRVLITSRAPVKHPEEQLFRLDGLRTSEACALFAERAARHVQAPQGDDVRELVEVLDRLPLAVELAATRANRYAPRELIDQMNRRFDLLQNPAIARTPRHQTLWATIEWSWQLLSVQEQRALAQCSVFEGGFSPEAAEAVVDLGEDIWVEPILASLVDYSLLTYVKEANTVRLSMSMSVQDFARQRLGAAPNVESRHGRYYAKLFESDPDLKRYRPALRSMSAELANLVVAAQRGLRRGDIDTTVRCALHAAVVYNHEGPLASGMALLERAQAASLRCARQQMRVSLRLGVMQKTAGGDLERAETNLRNALKLAERLADHHAQCQCWLNIGQIHQRRGEYDDALAVYTRTRNIARQTGEPSFMSKSLGALANLHKRRGDFVRARACYEDGLRLSIEAGDKVLQGTHHSNFGTLLGEMGHLEEAADHFQRALDIARQIGDRSAEGVRLGHLGTLYQIQGEETLASHFLEQAFSRARQLGDRHKESHWLYMLGVLYLRQGAIDRARASLVESLRIAEEIGFLRGQAYSAESLAKLALDGNRTQEGMRLLQRSQRIYENIGNRSGLISVRCQRAWLYHRVGDRGQARKTLEEVYGFIQGMELTEGSVIMKDIARLEAELNT